MIPDPGHTLQTFKLVLDVDLNTGQPNQVKKIRFIVTPSNDLVDFSRRDGYA